jgi:hypothetical protein
MVLEILSRPGAFLFFSFDIAEVISFDAADPNNYRGITITSSVGKVFNSILNKRLDSFLKQNNIRHHQIYVLQRYNLQPMTVDICHETDRN